MSFDTIWAVCVADGDPKVLFVGKETGILEKVATAAPHEVLLTIEAHTSTITGIAPTSAEEVYTCSLDKTVKLWNAANEVEGKRLVKTLEADEGLRCLAVQGDTIFAGADAGTIFVFTADGVSKWAGHSGTVSSISITESQVCSSGYDNQIRVWDFAGHTQFILLGHENHVKFSTIIGTNVVSSSRDQTLRVWSLPGETDEAPPEPKEGEDGDATGTSAAPSAGKVVFPSGSVSLPSVPTSHTIAGAQLFIGCSDSNVVAVNTKQLISNVVEFERSALKQHQKSLSSVRKQVAECSSREKKKLRTALKLKQKKLLAEQAAAVAEEAQKKAAEKAAENEDDEEPQDDAEAEVEAGEDDSEPVLSADLQKIFEEFKSQKEAKTNEVVAEAERIAVAHEEAIAPLLKKKYELPVEKFHGAPFTRAFGQGCEAVHAIAVDGTAGFVADGSRLREVPLQIGVTSL